MMDIHLKAAWLQVEQAKGHLKSWKENGIKVIDFFYVDALKQAEDQVALAEL